MATRPVDFGRFFHHYRKYFVILGCLLAVHVFLAVRVILLHAESNGSNNNEPGSVKISAQKSADRPRLARLTTDLGTNNNYTTLDKSSLPFDLPCEINSKEGISAINRAKTASCKEQLALAACRIVAGNLYPKRLPRLCLNNVTSYGRHLGCYRDDKKTRILPEALTLLKETNSPENCIDLCLQAGFTYAGVQYSIECFCGHQPPSNTLLLHDKECNMKCPLRAKDDVGPETDNNLTAVEQLDERGGGGESSSSDPQSCGGFFAMNIYETGIFQDIESGNQVVPYEVNGQRMVASKPARIVFLLTLNGRAFRQVIRLIKSLFHQRHFFYIHVDARQDYLFRELLILKRILPNNFRFMTKRRATIWGGASLLTVLLDAMEDLVTHAEEWNWPWDYVINLSESDFPLKTTEKLETFLSLNNGRNFIKSHGRDVQKFIQKQGLDKTFFECEYRMWRIGERVLPKGILIDGGSDWIALHREFVEYVVKTDDELVRGLKVVFKHTLLPAESFFHTVVRNSAMCATFVDNNLHVTNWKRKLGCKCQYRNIVDWCGCSPNDFRTADWSRLQLTENRLLFFGRKFEPIVNQGIINKLENWLYPDRFPAHAPTLDRYWQNIYHHHDISPPPDDPTLTLTHSLSRIATQVFISRNPLNFSCTSDAAPHNSAAVESSPKVLEMHIFLLNDQTDSLLVRFHRELGKNQKLHIALEARFSFRYLALDNPNCKGEYCGRISNVDVGLEYDQKEQIFRHFSRVMGPLSEPTLAYNSLSPTPFNVTFQWINPGGVVRALNNVTIPEGSTANFIKPHLASPLLPGNWTVKVYSREAQEEQLLTQVVFLIVPLQFLNGVPISSKDASFMHSYSQEHHHEDEGGGSESELISRIDSLVSRHYTFEDICLESEEGRSVVGDDKNKEEVVSLCSQTDWSSMYPDPKFSIRGIDSLNGFLVP